MDNKTLDKLRKRIAKLLSLAGNNPNKNEAETAMAMAQELMVKAGLGLDDFAEDDTSRKVNKEVVHVNVTDGGNIIWWKGSLGMTISDNFRCFCYKNTQRKGYKLTLVGLKQDVEVAVAVYKYAETCIEHASKEYIKQYKKQFVYTSPSTTETTSIRNDFIRGYIKGIASKLRENVQQMEQKWGLVIVKDALVTQEEKNLKLRYTKGKSVNGGRNAQAYNEGFNQGKTFDHNRKRISNE